MNGVDAIDLVRFQEAQFDDSPFDDSPFDDSPFDHPPFDGGAIGAGRRLRRDPSEPETLFVILPRGRAIGVDAP